MIILKQSYSDSIKIMPFYGVTMDLLWTYYGVMYNLPHSKGDRK